MGAYAACGNSVQCLTEPSEREIFLAKSPSNRRSWARQVFVLLVIESLMCRDQAGLASLVARELGFYRRRWVALTYSLGQACVCAHQLFFLFDSQACLRALIDTLVPSTSLGMGA